MSCEKFCTCVSETCPHHPRNHNYQCTACIEKSLRNHEIPICFFNEIGNGKPVKSNYTFLKFAEKVMSVEKDSH